MKAFEAFTKIVTSEEVKKVEFDPKWRNGTGYYNGAVRATILQPGEVATSRDEAPNNRRLVLIGTRFGNVVVFERFTPDLGEPEVLVADMPTKVTQLLRQSGAIDDAAMNQLVGDGGKYDLMENIGKRIERLFAPVKVDLSSDEG